MSRQLFKGKRFQEILERYVSLISLWEKFLISANAFNKHFSKESHAIDPQVLHIMTFKTDMKTSSLVSTDVEQAVENSSNYTEMEDEISAKYPTKTPSRQVATGQENKGLQTPSAKKQGKHSTTSRVFPYITFALQTLPKCLTTTQSFEASLFVKTSLTRLTLTD